MNLLALLGGKKSPDKEMDDDEATDPAAGSPADTYAREAYSALKDDDEEGFVSALTSMVKACAKTDYDETEPDADDEE